MVGFPPVFRRTGQLKTFLYRFLWNNVFHTSVNYALAPDFLPISPSKLYEYTDGTKMPYLQAVPGSVYAVVRFLLFFINFYCILKRACCI